MYIGLLLKRMEFTVIPAENGIEALRLVKLLEPDVVILDVHMEMMDGVTVLRHMKEDKQTSRIPVIMASTDSNKQIIEQCKSLGCFDYLLKPVKLEKLHDCIQKCFFGSMGTNRNFLRALYNRKVEVTYQENHHKLYAENLSEGGIYLRKKDPLPVGSEVEVTLSLKDKDTITLKGVVIYIKELFGDFLKLPPGMAIEFKGLSEDDYKLLRNYIKNLMAEDIIDDQDETVIES
jgi:uncharacterized protein (TIGR02266 family)